MLDVNIRLRVIVLFSLYCIPLLAQRSVEVQFSNKVSQQILQRTVRELVLIGNRMGGTNSGDQAVRMISTRFKEYGLSVEILESPERLTYTHHQWKLKVESPKRLRGLIQNEWLAGFSPSVSETVCELKYIRPGALTLDSVRNRAVLINVPLTHELYEELSNAGIRCILHYSVVNSEAYMHGAMITQLTPSQSNKVPVYNISRFAGERLRQELEYGTPITLRYSSKTVIRYGNSKTVIATLKGKSSQYYIVCAHGDSDSGGPGADDNASGVAGILEVARILSAMVRMKLIQPPVYTLRFIIWGTEYVSASDFVKKRDYELDQIRGVINVDQIGIGRPRYCVYFEGNDVPFNEHLLRVFNSIGEEYAGKQGFWKEATTIPFQGGTDSHVFLPQYLRQLRVRQREIPVITVFTAAWNEPKAVAQTKGWGSKAWKGAADTVIIGYSPYYHSSLDIPRLTTDREPHIVWGVKAVGIGLLRLAWDNTEISK